MYIMMYSNTFDIVFGIPIGRFRAIRNFGYRFDCSVFLLYFRKNIKYAQVDYIAYIGL